MGTSSSKDGFPSRAWRSSPLPSSLFIRRTLCDSPAPPPLPPLDSGDSKAPPPPPPAEKAETSEKEKDSIAEAAASVSALKNPGPYEQASMDCKRLVSLDTHDGFRVDINKQLSPFMAVVHSFWLGTAMLPDGRNRTYTFVSQVADEQGLLMARVDPERGSVDGRIHRALLGGAAMGKIQMGVSAGTGESDQLLAEVDFGGETWTGNLKYGSMGGGIVFGCNYFQSVTSRLAMGGEGMYLAANQNLLSNYTVKYTMPARTGEEDPALAALSTKKDSPEGDGGTATVCANYNASQGLVALNYKRIVTPNRVTLGAELQCSPLSLESQVMLGAEFKLTRSKIALCVDGTGKIQSTLEAKLGIAPGSPSLNFAAELDHAKDQMRFGYGINIEG